MAPTPYSVSPRRTLKRIGGKNSMKRSTRMPTALAAAKWPNSCRMMSTQKPAMARTQLMRPSFRRRASEPLGEFAPGSRAPGRGLPPSRSHRHLLGGDLARRAVGLEQRLEGPHRRRGHLLQGLLDDGGDARERQAPVEEGV